MENSPHQAGLNGYNPYVNKEGFLALTVSVFYYITNNKKGI